MYELDTAGVFPAETLIVLKDGENLGYSSDGESSYGDVMQACTRAANIEPCYDKVTQLHTHTQQVMSRAVIRQWNHALMRQIKIWRNKTLGLLAMVSLTNTHMMQ